MCLEVEFFSTLCQFKPTSAFRGILGLIATNNHTLSMELTFRLCTENKNSSTIIGLTEMTHKYASQCQLNPFS